MKLNLINKHNYRITSLLMLVIFVNISYSSNTINHVIISGQVTNMEYGNPVEGHTIYIKSDSTQTGRSRYSKVLKTNIEGYYYDTIATTEDNGSLIIYTYDHFGVSCDTTVYFRFIDRGKSVIIADFAIYLPYQAEELQARFKYFQKSGRDRNQFKFIDQTNHKYLVGWQWDFGDGTTSNLQNPTHSYQSYGLFKIKFTVTAIVNNIPIKSTITKQLYIGETEYYHLGGHVFSEYFPIDDGRAYLYMIDSLNRYTSIDTMTFDTLGYYYFFHIPKGDYVVKVEPTYESEYYGKLMPTYFGDKPFWEEAETIHLKHTNWECNIKLMEPNGIFDGEGGLGGKVEYINLPHSYQELFVEGVHIYLFDDSNNLLTCKYSDSSGDFSFDFIELNTYWLYPEIAGVHAEKIRMELTPEIPIISDIEILIDVYGIDYIFPGGEIDSDEIVGLPYPNPVSGTLSLPVYSMPGSKLAIDIFDMYGNKIFSKQVDLMTNHSNYQVSTANIKSGTYIIRAVVNEKTYNKVFIVAR